MVDPAQPVPWLCRCAAGLAALAHAVRLIYGSDALVPHSNRHRLHWAIVAIEVILVAGAVVTAYLSETANWKSYTVLSSVLVVLFVVVKVVEAYPGARELLTKEDLASKIAISAIPYGVKRYFNMQDPEDQRQRNEITQRTIRGAESLALCANSGASYLDPSIYRHWPVVAKRLEAGITFRVVLLDPLSGEKGFRNELNVGGEQFDSKMNLANLVKLHNQYPTLEIRFVRYGMHATVFATENAVFFDPYHVGIVGDRIENRSFCLFVERSEPAEGVGLHRLFKSHLDTLWREGQSFENWLVGYKDQLPPTLPEVRRRSRAS